VRKVAKQITLLGYIASEVAHKKTP